MSVRIRVAIHISFFYEGKKMNRFVLVGLICLTLLADADADSRRNRRTRRRAARQTPSRVQRSNTSTNYYRAPTTQSNSTYRSAPTVASPATTPTYYSNPVTVTPMTSSTVFSAPVVSSTPVVSPTPIVSGPMVTSSSAVPATPTSVVAPAATAASTPVASPVPAAPAAAPKPITAYKPIVSDPIPSVPPAQSIKVETQAPVQSAQPLPMDSSNIVPMPVPDVLPTAEETALMSQACAFCASCTVTPASQPFNSALAELNGLRAKRGLPALVEDPSLSAIAYKKASIQANAGATYHPGGTMGSARYEGVGRGRQFTTCYQNATNVRYAGAATVVGRNGQRYHCLLVR